MSKSLCLAHPYEKIKGARRLHDDEAHGFREIKKESSRPLLVVICGRPATLKSTVGRYINLLRFGLQEDEVRVFELDSPHSMLYYDFKTSREHFPNLKLIIVEGYNAVPDWADRNKPDLIIEFTTNKSVRKKGISKRGWSKEHTEALINAPRIYYRNIDLVIDTSDFDLTLFKDIFSFPEFNQIRDNL